jgi:hypothetical protein
LLIDDVNEEALDSIGACIDAVSHIRRNHLLNVRDGSMADEPNMKCRRIRIASDFQTGFFIRGWLSGGGVVMREFDIPDEIEIQPQVLRDSIFGPPVVIDLCDDEFSTTDSCTEVLQEL